MTQHKIRLFLELKAEGRARAKTPNGFINIIVALKRKFNVRPTYVNATEIRLRRTDAVIGPNAENVEKR